MLDALALNLATPIVACDPVVDSGYSSISPSKPSPVDSDRIIAPHSGKRPLQLVSGDDESDAQDNDVDAVQGLESEDEAAMGTTSARSVAAPLVKRFCAGIRLPPLVSPKSVYEGWKSNLPVCKERTVLREFQELEEDEQATKGDDVDDVDGAVKTTRIKRKAKEEEDEFISYKLEDFTFYYPAYDKRFPLEMTCLHNLSVKAGKDVMLFDGILTNGKVKQYVEGVPCERLSIGNYEDLSSHSVDGAIWIQTSTAKGAGDVWYELGLAAKVYQRYHTPFLWLANFAKFFVDFLSVHQNIELADFKQRFYAWIQELHGQEESFGWWYGQYNSNDFRQAVAAHYEFLWNQSYNMNNLQLVNHPIWDEVMRLQAIKPAPGKLVNETIVTPIVYDCFYHIFGDKLKSINPRIPPSDPSSKVKLELDRVEVLTPTRVPRDEYGRILQPQEPIEVKAGDVVGVVKDVVTNWKGKSEFWYVYVQHVNRRSSSKRDDSDTLDVIWLYLPEDTILGQMRYPYPNELFFSDNCNCVDAKLRMDEVVFKVSTAFFCGPGESGAEYFIRQKFSDAESNFTTLTEKDLTCECRKPIISAYERAKQTYEPGDTVLVESDGENYKDILEPAQIVRFDEETQCVELRQLFRRARDFTDKPNAVPNELVYTDYLVLVPPQYLYRRCHIRFFLPDTTPISPYDRDGSGDCFFITHRRTNDGDLKPCFPAPEGFNEGFHPDFPPPGLKQLNGMDLFCGGGNFGRGIEEGGAVVNKWAVDLDIAALHTYRANLRGDPKETHLYLGSVNNYLRDALLGHFSSAIPPPGQVGFISAGSPCQGFSLANMDRDSERSLQNSSLVASVASFCDFYRPKFALLENVHGLADDRVKKSDGHRYNVFSQLLCSLVAIGYQCQQFTLDAWSFGSCQTRTRLFVSIAAPGQVLPPRPGRSHEHPSTVRSKSLFEAPNGKKFGGRELHGPCIYPFVSTAEKLGDLPWLGDNHPGICTPYPDHRHSRIESSRTRLLMTHIPKVRHCASLRRAINANRMPPSLDFYNRTQARSRDWSRSWSRIFGEELCRTVTTTITPQCSFTGQWMHWDQHRLLTVMEVRRIQSFPDWEVLLGGAVKAFRIVGNSVDRTVALAWGCAIREAWWGKSGGGSLGKEMKEGGRRVVGWTKGFRDRFKEYVHVNLDNVPLATNDDDHQTQTSETRGTSSDDDKFIDAQEHLSGEDEDRVNDELDEESRDDRAHAIFTQRAMESSQRQPPPVEGLSTSSQQLEQPTTSSSSLDDVGFTVIDPSAQSQNVPETESTVPARSDKEVEEIKKEAIDSSPSNVERDSSTAFTRDVVMLDE